MESTTTVAVARQRTRVVAVADWWLLAGLLVVAALLTAYDPPGYFGGRWDDGRYLEAAIAWADHGPQLGVDHWALRWPVVLPAAAMIDGFGRTRAALMIPGLLTYFSLIALNFVAARRVFGAAVATVAVFALMTTDVVFGIATRVTADLPEALFWTASVWAFVFAVRADGARQRGWLIVAGIAAGLAFATRETGASLVIAAAIAFVAGIGPVRWRYGWIAAGFLAILLPEQLILGIASGDWLYRLHTDLHHIEIPSTNLAGLVAPHAFAPMNTDLMERWVGAGPVHWWWATDTWINLFLNDSYGLDFAVAAFGCLLLAGRTMDTPGRWRVVAALALLAATHIVMVVYIVATDPKPRMFLPAAACACLIVALAVTALWPRLRLVRPLLVAVAVYRIVTMLFSNDILSVAHNSYAGIADRAVAAVPGTLHVDRWTRSRLDLTDPAIRDRLSTAEAPVGGLWMTSGNYVDDARGDTRPPAAGRWVRVARIVSTRQPWTFVLVQRAAGLPSIAAPAKDYHPALTIYRRIG